MDHDKIPIELYNSLVDLMGKDEAERFIENQQYNYQSLVLQVHFIRIRKFITKNKWVGIALIVVIFIIIYKYFTDFESWNL